MEKNKPENLVDALTRINSEKVKTLINNNSVSKYFDRFDLTDDGEPKIVTKNNTLIILDNQDWNSTYLIDLFVNYFESNSNQINIDLIYIDNPRLRYDIQYPNKPIPTEFYTKSGELNISYLEMELLRPSIILLNPDKNILRLARESKISVIDENDINELMNFFDNDFCDKYLK